MERKTSIVEAKKVLGLNFIGPDELTLIADKIGIRVPIKMPSIPFSLEELTNKIEDFILILGSSQMKNGEPLTLKSLRDHFGINPDISEPCFYNQDWYLKEKFIEKPLESKWFLIRKNIFQETRAKNPEGILNQHNFPSAILCAYSFFAAWFYSGVNLWKYDFVWCNDLDHNGDRIYVGKYFDIEDINKNGFSIHRHLSLRNYHGCIEVL